MAIGDFSTWLVWQERERLKLLPIAPSAWGLLALARGMLIYLVGSKGMAHELISGFSIHRELTERSIRAFPGGAASAGSRAAAQEADHTAEGMGLPPWLEGIGALRAGVWVCLCRRRNRDSHNHPRGTQEPRRERC